eukprot:947703_1
MVTFGPHFYFAIILLLYNAISVNSFESVRTITVHITDENGASAPSVKATLWFDTAIYQFTIDKPQRNTEYSLSSNEFTTIGQSDCMDASDTKSHLKPIQGYGTELMAGVRTFSQTLIIISISILPLIITIG